MAIVEEKLAGVPDAAGSEVDRDLGFGSVVSNQSHGRLLNKNGTFNLRREGLSPLASLSLYHDFLTISWPRFLGLIILIYLAFNGLFAGAYFACGPGALQGATAATTGGSEFLRDFFFSVETFATIGYGHIAPATVAANVLMTVESLVGLLGFALATGVLFARFSRPTAKVLFSKNALIAPYHGMTAFEFRVANARSNQLIEVEAKVMVSFFRDSAHTMRDFYPLRLERQKVVFFPLSWTVVHPIDAESPLHGKSLRDLEAAETEFLILLTGIDETFSQTVHTRSSYKMNEVVWGARFVNLFKPASAQGLLRIDLGLLDDFEPAALPA